MEKEIIKYKEVIDNSGYFGIKHIDGLLDNVPSKIIQRYSKSIIYIIPCSFTKSGWCFHRLDGPAWIQENDIKYIYYGNKAKSKKQFYDPEWRKSIEIKTFI